MDIAGASITLEVTSDRVGRAFEHLRALVSRCRTLGFGDVRFIYGLETTAAYLRRLESFCAEEQLPPPELVDVEAPVMSALPPEPRLRTTGSPDVEYRMSFGDVENAVGALNKAVMLVGEAADLDARSQFMLRLCIYELIVNTVEHGTFDVERPEISVAMAFKAGEVVVSYADNAMVFLADNTSEVDMVEEHIKSSSKRGLGLYLLNNICDDWKCERLNDWNVTTFSLEINRHGAPVAER